MATRCKLVYIICKNHTCIHRWKMEDAYESYRNKTINLNGKKEKTRYRRIENQSVQALTKTTKFVEEL